MGGERFERKFNDYEQHLARVDPVGAMQHMVERSRIHQFQYNIDPKAGGYSGGYSKQGPGETFKGNRDRVALMLEARDAMRNVPFLRGVVRRIVKYSISRLTYRPNTGDRKVDRVYRQYVNDVWAPTADITGRLHLEQLVRIWLGSFLVDGDVGAIMVQEHGDLRLQTIEADRIGDIRTEAGKENLIGGVHVTTKGRVEAYDIYRRSRHAVYQFEAKVKPASFLHIFDPERVSEFRGRSFLAPVRQYARDMAESMKFELGAAKLQAMVGGFYRTNDPTDPMANGWDPQKELLDNSAEGIRDKYGNYNPPGNKLIRLGFDEQIEWTPGVTRPSGAFQTYIEIIVRAVAQALDMPYGFIWDRAAFGGVTARFDVEEAQRTIRYFQSILVRTALTRIQEKVILYGIAKRLIPPHENALRGTWHFGRWLTADIAHETNADLSKIQAGAMSMNEFALKYDLDLEQIVDENIAYTKMVIDKCGQAGVPIEIVYPSMGGATEQIAAFKESKNPPPAKSREIMSENPAAGKNWLELFRMVTSGEMERENVVMLLIQHGVLPEDAEAMTPVHKPAAGNLHQAQPSWNPSTNGYKRRVSPAGTR